jgi:DNA-binding SARP family transcriptional activator
VEEVPAPGGSARFDILGPLQLWRGDQLVSLRRVKEKILLGLLVLHSGEVVSLDHLAGGLWENVDLRPPATLRVHMSRLRRSLAALGPAAPALVTSGRGYALEVSPAAVDVRRFERLAGQGRRQLRSGAAAEAANTLRRALELWRGPVLEDLGLSAALEQEQVRLEESRLDALEDRIEADLMCGGDRELVTELERLTGNHPWRERLWAHRMVALYRSGRQAEALRTYQDLRLLLAEQLGILPGPDLQRLEQAVLLHDPDLEIGTLATPPAFTVPGRPILVADVDEVPAPGRLITDGDLPFCGRRGEIESMLECLKLAANGELKLMVVSGEAGIGKTRLAAEIARRALDHESTVLYGRCDEGLAVPFQPFVEALTQVHRSRPPAQLFGRYAGELVRLLPDLTSVIPDLPPPLEADPETERYRLFDAVGAWLGSISATSGAMLVIDDLQWGEQSTLLLLRHLVRSAEPMRLLIVVTYRDTDLGLDDPLTNFLADLPSDPRVHRMRLEGLDLSEVSDMVSGVRGQGIDETARDLARLLWSETAGNPLFVQEILRSLVERGVLRDDTGLLTTSEPVTSITIPASVRDVVARRLGRLGSTTRRVLSVASVTGTTIDFDAVVTASGLDEDIVLDALDEATGAAIVRETPSGSYEFVHPLIQSTLYGNLGPARRHRRHLHIAEALLGRPTSDPASISYHLDRANVTDLRIIDQLASAGEDAMQRLAFDEAVAYFTRALDAQGAVAAPDQPRSRRCELLIRLGTAQRFAALPAHRHTLLEAAQVAQDLGDANLLARAVLTNNRGFASVVGAVDAERVRFIEAALAAAGPGDSPGRARLLSVLSLETIWDDPGLRRVDLANEAVATARRLDDEPCLLETWTAAHVAGSVPDQIPRLLSEAPALIGLAERIGNAQQLSGVCAIASIHYLQFGHLGRAKLLIDRIGHLANEFNHPFLRWVHANHHCCHLTLSGTGNQIEAAALEALQLGQRAGQPDVLSWFGPQLFAARWAQGRLAEMVGLVGQVVSGSPALPAWRAALALAHISAGDHRRGVSMVDELMADPEGVFAPNVAWLLGHSVLAEAVAAVGTPEQAARQYQVLRPYAGRIPNLAMVARPAVSLWLGMLAARAGWSAPVTSAHFSDARDEHERIGARVFLARTRLEWGRFLLSQGDRTGGRSLLREAQESATLLGAAGIEEASSRLLAEVAT